MNNTIAKISIKVGLLEVDCQAEQAFLQNNLIDLVSGVIDLCAKNPDILSPNPANEKNNENPDDGDHSDKTTCFDYTVETIAARLGVKTVTELAIAAAGSLTFVNGKDRFTRKELLDEMKKATSYYNDGCSSNLSKTFRTLLKNKRLNAINNSYFSLTATEKDLLREKLKDLFFN